MNKRQALVTITDIVVWTDLRRRLMTATLKSNDSELRREVERTISDLSDHIESQTDRLLEAFED